MTRVVVSFVPTELRHHLVITNRQLTIFIAQYSKLGHLITSENEVSVSSPKLSCLKNVITHTEQLQDGTWSTAVALLRSNCNTSSWSEDGMGAATTPMTEQG